MDTTPQTTTKKVDRTVAMGRVLELEPEVVLPSQFHSKSGGDAGMQPERRLMLAVLEEAVATYQRYTTAMDPAGRELFQEADEWIATEDHEWPFSFVNICHALGLEPSHIRSGLGRWREQRAAGRHGGPAIVRSPFRRISGSRHTITGRAPGLRHSA